MQYLEVVSRSPSSSWYRLLGEHQGKVQRWVASTPETVDIANHSEICGIDFSTSLSRGMSAALGSAPFVPFLKSVGSNQLCIMNFLRGSLNFDLRTALATALDSKYHATCFMSSQRYRREGRWHIKEDMYRKIKIPEGAVILVGDVVATGVTVDNGLQVIRDYLEKHKTSIRGLIFFTIGCHKLEKILEKYHEQFISMFPKYEATHLVYLEAKFRLVVTGTRLLIAIPGTDLIKQQALLSPELELSQYGSVSAVLERCAIYDAGSRAFDVYEYLDDVVEYWEQVRRLARRGYTLCEALKERWPEADYLNERKFREVKKREWRGVSREFLDDVWAGYKARWTRDFKKWAQTREALECVCDDRLEVLGRLENDFRRHG